MGVDQVHDITFLSPNAESDNLNCADNLEGRGMRLGPAESAWTMLDCLLHGGRREQETLIGLKQ